MNINLASPEQTAARHARMAAAYTERQKQEAGMRQARALLRQYLKTETELVEIMQIACSNLSEIGKFDSDTQETVQIVDEVCDAITYRYAA